jgi:uncharacterized membrane protein YjdF
MQWGGVLVNLVIVSPRVLLLRTIIPVDRRVRVASVLLVILFGVWLVLMLVGLATR